MPTDEMDARAQLDLRMAEIAQATGAVLHVYPRPGRAVRRVILRDFSDDRGTRSEAAQIEDDGTLRIVGHDTGRRVSEFSAPRSRPTNGFTSSDPGASARCTRASQERKAATCW